METITNQITESQIENAKKLTELFSNLREDGRNQVIGYISCLANMENAKREETREKSI